MSLTLEQAKKLKPGDILIDQFGKRWKVNGEVKRWKRDPVRVRIPLKHGLYAYDAVSSPNDFVARMVDGEAQMVCDLLTLEAEVGNQD